MCPENSPYLHIARDVMPQLLDERCNASIEPPGCQCVGHRFSAGESTALAEHRLVRPTVAARAPTCSRTQVHRMEKVCDGPSTEHAPFWDEVRSSCFLTFGAPADGAAPAGG